MVGKTKKREKRIEDNLTIPTEIRGLKETIKPSISTIKIRQWLINFKILHVDLNVKVFYIWIEHKGKRRVYVLPRIVCDL